MKKSKVVLRCSLCGAEHNDDRVVKYGWFAIYKTDKRRKLERVICPACLQRMGIKGNQN